ncbi:unnamed protein product [Closterium sp. NIES-54]
MDKVYNDILNLPEDGFNGERYVITFTDASTRYVWTGNMTNRFLAFTAFRTWLPLAERESDTKLKAFQCDGAGEYRSTEFTAYLQKCGIIRLFSLPHAHQQSGVAERLNRTLQEKMRALLAQAQLGPLYWPFAMDHATLLHNLLSSSSLPNNASPHLLWTGKLGKSCPPLPRPSDRRPSPIPLHRPPPPPPPRPRSPPQFQQPELHPPSASPSSPSLPRPASGSSHGASSAWTSTPPVPPAIRSRTS